MDDELDQLLDGLEQDAAEAAEPDDDASAADADLADGQDEAEAADDDAEAAADAEEEESEPDELSQLRARLEAVEAERANEAARQQAYARQVQAAQREAQVAQSEAAWDDYFARLADQAKAEAQQTYDPLGAYEAAMAGIIQQWSAKKQEFANYRTGQYASAYYQSQVPAYVQYLANDLNLGDLDRAELQQLAAEQVDPNSIRRFALSLKKRADLETQERRAQKQAALKKSSAKPGGGSPHKAKIDTLDKLVDSLFG